MKRRQFLQRSGALIALGLSAKLPAEGLMPDLGAEAAKRLVESIENEMLARHIPGLSACLVHKDGHILWGQNLGYANLATNEKMTFDHVQNIASISKTFTTVAAMQ